MHERFVPIDEKKEKERKKAAAAPFPKFFKGQ